MVQRLSGDIIIPGKKLTDYHCLYLYEVQHISHP